MKPKDHWERVYASRPPDRASWFQEHAEQSLRLIRNAGVDRTASIIDVGGGASTLVDDLLGEGYSAITVLDVSAMALDAAKARFGPRSNDVQWLVANILDTKLPAQAYDVWHDRAVFHFLTSAADRQAYVAAVLRAVRPGGHVIVAIFADDGPDQCSGLPVVRYRPDELHAEFGSPFTPVHHEREDHRTPSGAVQRFIYCYCRRASE